MFDIVLVALHPHTCPLCSLCEQFSMTVDEADATVLGVFAKLLASDEHALFRFESCLHVCVYVCMYACMLCLNVPMYICVYVSLIPYVFSKCLRAYACCFAYMCSYMNGISSTCVGQLAWC